MYLLDSNVLIESARTYYAFDIAPGFWSWLSEPALASDVGSIEAVRDELILGNDQLVRWARDRPSSFWLPATGESIAAARQIAGWVTDPARPYRSSAVEVFLASADYRLIAQAASANHTVVTRERPQPDSSKSVKIPDACDAVGVAWIDPFTAYHRLGLRLAA